MSLILPSHFVILKMAWTSDRSEIEPIFTQISLNNDINSLISGNGPIMPTCLSVSTKLLALGSADGTIHIFDIIGNSLERTIVLSEKTDTVRCIRFEHDNETLVACSSGGKAAIINLFDDSTSAERFVHVNEPAYCIDIVATSTTEARSFVVGGKDNVHLFEEQKLFGITRFKSKIVHRLGSFDWPVHSIRVRGANFAFTDSHGIGIIMRRTVGNVVKNYIPHGINGLDFPNLKSLLFWSDDTTIVLGANRTIKIVKITGKSQLNLHIVASFQIEFGCYGIFPFDSGSIAVFVQCCNLVQLRLYQPFKHELRQLCSMDIEKKSIIDCDFLKSEMAYYLLCEKSLVFVRPRDEYDHVKWLIERNRIKEAIMTIEKGAVRPTNNRFQELIESILDKRIRESQHDLAASEIRHLLIQTKADQDLWNEVFQLFCVKCETHIKDLIKPIPASIQIFQADYVRVLKILHRQNEFEIFRDKLKEWTLDTDSLTSLIKIIEEREEIDSTVQNQQNLASCFEKLNDCTKAIHIYLRIRDERFFEIINAQTHVQIIKDNISLITSMDEEKSIDLFCAVSILDNDVIDWFVQELTGFAEDQILHKYLSKMFEVQSDLTRDYQNRQVALYAKYDPDNLLNFLQKSTDYSLQQALDFCLFEKLYREAVHLLARVGRSDDALRLMVIELSSMQMSVKFCEEYDDDGEQGLWAKLIELASTKLETSLDLLSELCRSTSDLRSPGAQGVIDLALVLDKIQGKVCVQKVVPDILRIIRSQTKKAQLLRICTRCVDSEAFEKLTQFVDERPKGICIDHAKCDLCLGPMLPIDDLLNIATFSCGHIFHRKCILNESVADTCAICRKLSLCF